MRFPVLLLLLLLPASGHAQLTILSGAKTCRQAQQNCNSLCNSYFGSGGSDCRQTCVQTRKDCAETGCFNTGVQFDCGLKD